MKNGKMILGLLAGAAAGALTGVLLAPEKGSVTRNNLSRRSRESIDGIKTRVNDLVETVSEKYIGGRSQRGAASTAGRTRASERTRSSQHSAPGAPSAGNI